MPLAGDSRCPVCSAALWAPDVEPIGEKTCPRCGAELWALIGSIFFLRQEGQSKYRFLAALVARIQGMSVDQMEVALENADSLDLVEIIGEIDEAMRSSPESSE